MKNLLFLKSVSELVGQLVIFPRGVLLKSIFFIAFDIGWTIPSHKIRFTFRNFYFFSSLSSSVWCRALQETHGRELHCMSSLELQQAILDLIQKISVLLSQHCAQTYSFAIYRKLYKFESNRLWSFQGHALCVRSYFGQSVSAPGCL